MTTYNNILDFLKERRDNVIEAYNRTNKEISLKDYMNEVIRYFDEHKGKTNKVLKGSLSAYNYLSEAIRFASNKANAKAWRAVCKAATEEHINQMGCRGWYEKNYR